MFWWLGPTGFLVSLLALYLSLKLRWVEALFAATASVFLALWGLHDALYYGAPTFYQHVAAAVFVLDGLAVLLAVLAGTMLRKAARVRAPP